MSRPRRGALTLLGLPDPVPRAADPAAPTPEQALEEAIELIMARLKDYQERLTITGLRTAQTNAGAQQVADVAAEWMTGLHSDVGGLWVAFRDYLRQGRAVAEAPPRYDATGP